MRLIDAVELKRKVQAAWDGASSRDSAGYVAAIKAIELAPTVDKIAITFGQLFSIGRALDRGDDRFEIPIGENKEIVLVFDIANEKRAVK